MKLPNRQRQIIELIANGKADKEIAEQLRISVHTVAVHVRCLLRKFSARSRGQAAVAWERSK